jgi:hypothetical protein
MRGFIDGEYQDGELYGRNFIAGKSGTGKTTEMARLISQCGGGAVFFDPLSKHEPILPGFRLFHQPGDVSDYLRINRDRRYRILYQPRSGKVAEHFQALCLIVRAFGKVAFAVDELDMVSGPQWGSSWMAPEFYSLVNYGRHEGVIILATARYPNSVPRGFTSQCSELRLFAMTEPKHLRYFEEYIGQGVEQLRRLAKFQFLHFKAAEEQISISGGRH